MRSIEPHLQDITPNPSPRPCITPLHITNMAKFNELILSLADEFLTEPGCHPAMTAHALTLLMHAITTTHFDLIRTMATLDASCDEIAEGKYDRLAAPRDTDLAAQLAQQRDVVAELPSEHIKSGNPEFPAMPGDPKNKIQRRGSFVTLTAIRFA